MASIRKRGNRWYIRITVRLGEDMDGNPVYKWVERGSYTTREEALAQLHGSVYAGNPIKKRRKKTSQGPYYIPDIIIDQVLDYLSNKPEQHLVFLLSLHYHLTIPEICGLMVSDYDRHAGTLTVSRIMCRGSEGEIYYRDIKTKIIFLTQDDRPTMYKYLHNLTSVSPYLNYPSDPMFINPKTGGVLTPRHIRWTTKQIRKNIYPSFSLNDWRRIYGD